MSTVAQPTNSDPSTEQPRSIAAIKCRRRFLPKAESTPQEPDTQFKPSARKPRARGRTATSIPPAAGVAPGNVPIPAPPLTNLGQPQVLPNRKADGRSRPLRGKGRVDVARNPLTSNPESAPISQPLPLTGPSGPISVHQGPSEKKPTEGKGKGVARGLAVKKNEAPAQLFIQEAKDALQAVKCEQERLQKAKEEDHYRLVLSAAKATIAVLNKHGISCATIGSLACKLYGTFRDPNDVDLLVFEPPNPNTPPRTAEEIKALILDTDPRHFFLKMPRDPEAPYRILHYRQEYLEAQCKVDILIPGIMYLPNLSQPSHSILPRTDNVVNISTAPPLPLLSSSAIPVATDIIPPSPPNNHITTISGIPLVPFSLLLLHKLQGWDDHCVAPEPHKQRKQAQDAADVRRLMAMGKMMKELQLSQPWADSELFCEEFQQLTKERVKKYCLEFPDRAVGWQMLGFETA
ncbi:hypothetical protein AN958_08108 [Leucoagaricus sp. SymC.cos]|nr:hypothetical protein AN958_08108 [Leucoagaricus sp. SymC.cos]